MITQMLFLLTLPIITAAVNSTFRCTAGTFFAGETAVITCYFPEDVSEQYYNYYVEWYPHNSTDHNNANEALECYRKSRGQLDCHAAAGFRFNDVINDRLVLEIPKVSERYAGRYSCMYIPPNGNKVEACGLHVSVIPKTKERQNPSETTRAQSTKTSDPESETCKEEVYIAALIAVSAGMSVILLITLVICIFQRRSAQHTQCRCFLQCAENLVCIRKNGAEVDASFRKWWQGLPKPVRTALLNKGFDHPLSLEKISGKHIKTLGLKEGHALLLKEKLKNLPQLEGNKRNRSPVSMESEAVDSTGATHVVRKESLESQRAQYNSEKQELTLPVPQAEVDDNNSGDMDLGKEETKPLRSEEMV